MSGCEPHIWSQDRHYFFSECFLFIYVSIFSNPYLLPAMVLWVIISQQCSWVKQDQLHTPAGLLWGKTCSFILHFCLVKHSWKSKRWHQQVYHIKFHQESRIMMSTVAWEVLFWGLDFTQLWQLGNLQKDVAPASAWSPYGSVGSAGRKRYECDACGREEKTWNLRGQVGASRSATAGTGQRSSWHPGPHLRGLVGLHLCLANFSCHHL